MSTWRTPPAPLAPEAVTEEYSADVVIVGLGNAGASAARAAAEAGASVIVLEKKTEKQHRFKGGGQVGHINSRFLADRGVPPVDLYEFVNDWQTRSNNRSNAGLIWRYAKNSGEAFDWLAETLTEEEKAEIFVSHHPTQPGFSGTVNGMHTWAGCACMGRQMENMMRRAVEKAQSLGARVLYGVSGDRLEMENGRCVGAIGRRQDGSYIRVRAGKGVLLSGGGFGGNKEMCHELLTDFADLAEQDYKAYMGEDGSGICMGLWAGGRLEPRPLAAMGGNYFYPQSRPDDPLGTTPALWLNAHGKRFCNEGFGDAVLAGLPSMQQPRRYMCAVFDSRVRELITHSPIGHMAFDLHNREMCEKLKVTMEGAAAAGAEGFASPGMMPGSKGITVWAADDPATLAGYLGYTGQDAENFVASIARYNALCAKGLDDDFGRDPQLLVPLDSPPYFAYGAPITTSPRLCTCGGLMTDTEQNVLGQDFEPIPGLYASGNNCGGRFGAQYSTPISGVSLGIAMTLGREVGRTIAAL